MTTKHSQWQQGSECTINICDSLPSLPCQPSFRLLQSILLILVCMGGLACSKPHASVSTADLRASLHPWRGIGTYAGFDSARGILYLGNHLIERRFHLNRDGKSLRTIHYTHKLSGRNYIGVPSEEFKFRVGEIEFSGNSDLLKYHSYQVEQSIRGEKRLIVELRYSDETEKPIFHVKLHYEVYPDLPMIRKWITFENVTDFGFFLEDIVIESLPCRVNSETQIDGHSSEPIGNSEAFIFAHVAGGNGGMILGNEAPGILKYYEICSGGAVMQMGLTPTASINGVEVRVPPKTLIFTSKVWTMLFEGDRDAARKTLKHALPPQVLCLEKDAGHISSITWTKIHPDGEIPTGDFIVVDYGWNGENLSTLQQMSRHVHDDGRKFGIRLPIAEVNFEFLDRPEWHLTPVANFGKITEDVKAKVDATALQMESSSTTAREKAVYCVLSDYGYYLWQAVNALLKETEADLLVFDRPMVGVAGSALKGCGAFGHAHFSRRESIGLIYQWMFEFANHLHQQHPNLQLGITSIAYGVGKPDIAVFDRFDLFFP